MDHAHAMITETPGRQGGMNVRLIADQVKSGDFLLASSASLAPAITTPQPWSPPMTSTAIRIDERENAEPFRDCNAG